MSVFSEWFNKAGSSGDGPGKANRKKLMGLAAVVILGISLIILGSTDGREPTPPAREKSVDIKETDTEKSLHRSMMAQEEEALASKLQAMLERIEGSGEVKVTVRLASSNRETFATNTTIGRKNTVEKDQGGGTRTINENTDTTQLVIAKNGNGDSPVVEMESASRIAGVLVVAQGAANPRVKENLFNAVRVALNVDPHKILVLTGEGGAKR
ncbi:MAG: hypothetical protein ACOY30_09445 [Bacillota bacterium]